MDKERETIIRDIFSQNLFARLLGMKLLEIEDGSATIELEVRDDLRQAQGLLHGGATATLIDTATGFATSTLIERGQRFSTIDLTVHYMRPVTEGIIRCKANVIRNGRRIVTLDAEALSDSGKQVATALTTYMKQSV